MQQFKNRYRYGEPLGFFWAYSLVGSKGSSGSHGRTDLCAGVLPVCPPPSRGWNPVNKNLFFSTLIGGSYTKGPRASCFALFIIY